MSPLSRLFARNRDRLAGTGPGLWVNPPPDLPWSDFSPPGGLLLFTQDEATRRALASRGAEVAFGAFPPATPVPAVAVLSLPREKARLRMLACCLADHLAPHAGAGGILYAAGEVRAGGKSAPRQLDPWFGAVTKIDSARHCVLFEARKPRPDGRFDPDAWIERWTLDTAEGSLTLCSFPGVFAHGGLDDGTRLLLDTLAQVLSRSPGPVLDVGCGTGVIGAALARRFPALDLTLADSSALALAAARATLEANGIEGRVVASDGLAGIEAPDGGFGLIVSNPPFHAGHREREDLGAGVFRGIRNFLGPRGQFIMVANRHLPWRRWMNETFGAHEVLASDKGYHVLAHRP